MSDVKISIEDRLAVQDLFARYAWAFDKHDADAYVACFTEDGVVDGQNGVVHRGRDALKKMVQGFIDRRAPELCSQHLNDHILFLEADEESCLAYCYFTVVHIDRTPSHPRTALQMGGQYRTRCVKQDGRWLMKERQIRDWTSKDGVPWK